MGTRQAVWSQLPELVFHVREGEACAGVEKAGRKGREKWTVQSWKVGPSFLWSNKLQTCFPCWEAHSSPQPLSKGLLHAGWWQSPTPMLALYKALNEKPKLPCAQPERNWKNPLSCLFVPSPFPTLQKFSSIFDCYTLPFLIDCTSLLIPNCYFHFFSESGWPFRQCCHLSWHWNQRIFGYLMSSSWKSSQFSITFVPPDFFFLIISLTIFSSFLGN